MLRLTLIGFSLIVLLLLALSITPKKNRVIPQSIVELNSARLTLYPRADPEATWNFQAGQILYEPESRESTLINLEDGERIVADEVDFTLQSERMTIDGNDDLYGKQVSVHINDANWDLNMQAYKGRDVLIDQNRGKFEVPLLFYSGSGLEESRDENVRMNFNLTNFEAGGLGTIGYTNLVDEIDN